ncbi:MAG: aminodeoxychorismate/anthranilate synthase component II [Candidatus Jacksonbacteria bacterium]|nr:aminodeoxychorismate/anthranilate synthase component II [Candidatus Jacksonbacteria bacterium]
MRVLILDNYDSFTYNLYQYVGEILQKETMSNKNETWSLLDVKRNDEITLAQIKKKRYDRIIISPGPGSPDDPAYFGVCADVLLQLCESVPILGVCLGMQGMAHYFGGRVVRARVPMHGKTSIITHDGKGVFTGLPQGLEVMRYHSLVVDPAHLPDELEITAKTLTPLNPPIRKGGKQRGYEIMGLRHKKYPIEGIQFHPESFATEGGKQMLRNFVCYDTLTT